jgi:putative redox protein
LSKDKVTIFDRKMITAKVEYLGDLRTKCTHVKSGNSIITDAPLDNNGKAEFFSPTDLVATAYASCMITIIGIYCNEHNVPFVHANAEVLKIMESNPRRIGEIQISLNLSGNGWDDLTAEKVIRAAKACPVAHSVHEGITMKFDIQY